MVENENDLAEIKKSLNNPIKQRILQYLKNNGCLSFGNIIKNLTLNPKMGTRHIIELKNQGLINYVDKKGLLELNTKLIKELKSEL